MIFVIHNGDCLSVLRTMPDCSVDAIVTDPPYGLSFMGKRWDYDVPSVQVWEECLRVLKPGGHLLAFAGARTQHRMAVNIEDAGFDIREMIAWAYASGFPKSLDVSKAIDKAAGAEREVLATRSKRGALGGVAYAQDAWTLAQANQPLELPVTAPATDAARQWNGWATALKPSFEPVTVARKPLIGTVAENVQQWGTGALNVDGCRVPAGGDCLAGGRVSTKSDGWDRPWKHSPEAVDACRKRGEAAVAKAENLGRWPANLIHDGSDEVVEVLGKAARFFYCPKASKRDRDEGCEALEPKNNMRVNAPRESEDAKHATRRGNHHPTVKPTELMRYLCRLVTPPGGLVLDPFMGSGSTGKAAVMEGFRFVGIELDAEYCKIAEARIQHVLKRESDLFSEGV